MYQTVQRSIWFASGLLAGLTLLSISKAAYVPEGPVQVTDDTAISQKLSEIAVKKEAKPNFDSGIHSLTALESRYQEKLPMGRTVRQVGQKKVVKRPASISRRSSLHARR